MKRLSHKYIITPVMSYIFMTGCSVNPLQSNQTPKWPVTEAEYNASLPDDVYRDSGNRLPIVNRDELDDARKEIFDELMSPNTRTRAGIRGPGGISLHGSSRDLSKSTVDVRTQEIARLVVSRETDQAFEWTLHERVALDHGLEPEIIDVIRYRKSLDGVPERDASIIQWGRELFQENKVSSETFARLLKNLGARDIVDLCYYMGNYVRTAILLHTVNAHLPYDRQVTLPIP